MDQKIIEEIVKLTKVSPVKIIITLLLWQLATIGGVVGILTLHPALAASIILNLTLIISVITFSIWKNS